MTYLARYAALLRDVMRERTQASKDGDWDTFRRLSGESQAIATVMAHQYGLANRTGGK